MKHVRKVIPLAVAGALASIPIGIASVHYAPRLLELMHAPPDVVRMGSTVTFKQDDGHVRTLKLVYPAEESLDAHRISVMTPVGAALIGLAVGQSISWTARDGKHHRLTVTKVA